MNEGTVSAYLIIMKSKGSVPTKDKSAKKKRKKENSKYCLPVSILARPSDHKTRQMGKTFSLQTTILFPAGQTNNTLYLFTKCFFFPKQIYVLKKSLEITYESKFSIFSFLFLTNRKVLINLGRVLISYQKKRFIIAGLTVFFKIIPKKAENLVNRLD